MGARRPPSRGLLVALGIAAAAVTALVASQLLLPATPAAILRFWLRASANTVILFLGSSALGLGIGFLAGWARASGHPLVNYPALAYIEVFRGIPRIVIALVAIVVFPAIGRLHPLLAWLGDPDVSLLWGILALGISSGAYQAEVFRSGFQTIPHGQIEAAHSLGMDYLQTMEHVTLPQVLRTVLPPLGNEWIIVLKDTSLLVVLTSDPTAFPSVFELTALAQRLQLSTPDVTVWPLIFLAAAATYLIFTLIISRTIQFAEERFKVPGLGVLPA